MDEKSKMLDKPVNELTLRDSLKINGIVILATAGIVTTWSAVSTWRENRRQAKIWNELPTNDTEA